MRLAKIINHNKDKFSTQQSFPHIMKKGINVTQLI